MIIKHHQEAEASGSVGPAWAEALAQGFDMSLVESSLRLAPWERLLEHDDALAFATALRGAVKDARAKPELSECKFGPIDIHENESVNLI